MFKAKLIGYGVRPREIEITSDDLPLTFGRGPQAGIRIEDRWTSRRHCELHEVDGVLWVDDLGSTHGTHVNGRETLHAPLAEGRHAASGTLGVQRQLRAGGRRVSQLSVTGRPVMGRPVMGRPRRGGNVDPGAGRRTGQTSSDYMRFQNPQGL